MAISQNARFSGEAAPDAEFEHPPGASIARLLREGLATRGWEVADFDNWRDTGWCIACCRPGAKLDLIVANEVKSDWFLQIAASYRPGLVGWLLSKRASAQPDAIHALAQDAFAVLAESGRFQRFLWCWDGYPSDGSSTPQPVPAQGAS